MKLNALKQAVQKVANAAGYEVFQRGSTVPHLRRTETVAELEAMYRRFVFPQLPRSEPRAALIARLEGTSASEAIYAVAALHRALAVPGEVCEFGVAQGATSALLAEEIRHTDKTLWLFDSFEGLPRPTGKDVLIHDIFNLGSMEKYEGAMAYGQSHVASRLRAIAFPPERVRIVPGFIEKTIVQQGLPGQVCFAYVDFDFYRPIRVALEYLDRVVPAGGQVLVDDYGWFSAGAQAAVDEFVQECGDRWELTLPLEFAGHFALLSRR